jgi:hypothetical protein
MMKVIVVFKRLLASGNDQQGRHLFKWVTAGIFLASILLKEMRNLVYIRYLWGGWLSGGMWAGRLYIPQLYDKKRPCSRANENGENYKPARPPVICIAQWLTTKSGSIGSSAKFNTNFLLTEFY